MSWPNATERAIAFSARKREQGHRALLLQFDCDESGEELPDPPDGDPTWLDLLTDEQRELYSARISEGFRKQAEYEQSKIDRSIRVERARASERIAQARARGLTYTIGERR